jgi:hypothetical protein
MKILEMDSAQRSIRKEPVTQAGPFNREKEKSIPQNGTR